MKLFEVKTNITNSTYTVLDVGSSKVCCAVASAKVAKKNEENTTTESLPKNLSLEGVSYHGSKGLRGHTIYNMDELESAILNAVHKAEQKSQHIVKKTYVSLPAGICKAVKVKANLALYGNQITFQHLRKLNLTAQGLAKLPQYKVLHLVSLSYKVDNADSLNDPKGMIGQNLQGEFLAILAPNYFIANLAACVGRCHLDIEAFVCSFFAAALACLDDDEKELGVTLIDFGSHSTSYVSFFENTLQSFGSIPLGGHQISNDIAQGLNVSLRESERLKSLYGTLIGDFDNKETVSVCQIGEDAQEITTNVSLGFLTHIIRSRSEEIVDLLIKDLKQNTDAKCMRRFVITGGASQLHGMRELIMDKLKSNNVRTGGVKNITGPKDITQNPAFSVTAGLLLFADKEQNQQTDNFGLSNQKNILSSFKKTFNWLVKNA